LWIGVGVFLAFILAELTVWTPSRIFGGLERLSPLSLLIGTAVGFYLAFYSYRYSKGRLTRKYVPWKDSLLELQKRESGLKTEEKETYRSTLETVLRLMSEAVSWYEEAGRYRVSASMNHGVVAYLISQDALLVFLILTNESLSLLSVPTSMAIGILSWLVSRRRRLAESESKLKTVRSWHTIVKDQGEDLLNAL
jgi:hypothetical protein